MIAKCMQIASMANLTIRNLPDDLHRKLKERAKRNRRSLNQEAIEELAAFREWPMSDGDERSKARERMLLAEERIDQLRKSMNGFMSSQEVAKARTEGRA